MSEQEGTIQFAYELAASNTPALDAAGFAELAAWRSILVELDLLGQHSQRYGGYAYGNLSIRTGDNSALSFVITASQTSGAPQLLDEHLVRITHCNLERFWVDAEGAQPPSSETITHAMVYAADPKLRCVFHVHNPLIWQQRSALKLPETAADVGYGSPAMCGAVAELMAQYQSRPLTFATAGHEDGIFACGHNLRDTGGLLVSYLAKARALALAEGSDQAPARAADQGAC